MNSGSGNLSIDAVEENIRLLIGEQNITYSDYARKIGINLSALQNILNGISKPRLDTLIKIANIEGVSLDWLCTKKGK